MRLVCLLFVLVNVNLKADGTLSSAALAAPLQNTASSARSAGMAGALYFSDGDSSLAVQNPAALSVIDGSQISLNHNSWIADIIQEVMLFDLPLGDGGSHGGLGLGVNYVDYGNFQGRDDTGRPTSTLGASDLGVSAGYGRKISGGLAGGLTINGLQEDLAGENYLNYSVNMGLLYQPIPSIWFSAAYSNLGTQIGGNQPATVLHLGAAATTRWGENAFNLGVGVDIQPQSADDFNIGSEIGLSQIFSVRIGYSLPLQDTDINGLQSVAFGATFKVAPVTVDYAYLPFGELGNVQRVSLSYAFTGPKPAPIATALPKSTSHSSAPPALPTLSPTPSAPPTALLPAPSPTAVVQASSNSVEARADLEMVMVVPDKDLDEARSLAAQGKTVAAINAYSQVIQQSPEDAVAWRELADLYFQVGKRDFGLTCYQEVVKLNPDGADLKAWIEKVRATIQ